MIVDYDWIKSQWILIANRDREALKKLSEIYHTITGEKIDLFGCGSCITKAYTEVSKHLFLKDMAKKLKAGESGKKYILKEGNHVLIPGGSTYNNLNLTDELAEKYISENPNLKKLFVQLPE